MRLYIFLFMLLAGQLQGQTKPDIITIMLDDGCAYDIGALGGISISPNMDALINSGFVTTYFYTKPVCSQSRFAIETGNDPCLIGMQHTNVEKTGENQVDFNNRFIASDLSENGYQCWMAGKWHLGKYPYSETPQGRGYHHFCGFLGGSGSQFAETTTSEKTDYHIDGEIYNATGFKDTAVLRPLYGWTNETPLDVPIYISIRPKAPHGPIEGTADTAQYNLAGLLQGGGLDGDSIRYRASMLTTFDKGLGDFLSFFSGVRGNPIIIFTSDNGCDIETFGQPQYKYEKSHLSEGGVRNFLSVSGGGIPVNVTDHFYTIEDIPRTILGLAGIYEKDDQVRNMTGKDVWSNWMTGTEYTGRDFIFSGGRNYGDDGARRPSMLLDLRAATKGNKLVFQENYKYGQQNIVIGDGIPDSTMYNIITNDQETDGTWITSGAAFDELRTITAQNEESKCISRNNNFLIHSNKGTITQEGHIHKFRDGDSVPK